MLTMNSCKTCPSQNDQENEFLSVDYVPDLKAFNSENPELKKILVLQNDMYSTFLLYLISMKETGMFITKYIDEEIVICENNIEWIDGILLRLELLE